MFEILHPSQSEIFAQNAFQANGNSHTGRALKLFRSALRNGSLAGVWARLARRSNNLLDLNELQRGLNVRNRHYLGIQAIAIDQIRGSEGRSHDFDAAFHPLREQTRDRWISVAAARLQAVPLPAVELIQVGDCYFVRDGHHRISVARALGETAIDAEVTAWDVKGALPWETPSRVTLNAQAA